MRQGKGSILMLIYDEFGASSVIWSTLFVPILPLTRFSIFTNDMYREVLWRLLNLFLVRAKVFSHLLSPETK